VDDASSSLPFLKPGLQTLGGNKRLRSDSDEEIEGISQSNLRPNNTSDENSSNLQMSSSNQNDYPPIVIEFKNKHDKSDRKLVEELVKKWKFTNNKNINFIGRFGVGGCGCKRQIQTPTHKLIQFTIQSSSKQLTSSDNTSDSSFSPSCANLSPRSPLDFISLL
jgi:hypothetical protein